MRQFLAFSMALLVLTGHGLYADGFAVPSGSTGTATRAALTEPFLWPVSTMIGGRKTRVVSKFGRRTAPGAQLEEAHPGVDFAVPEDSYVRASRPGKVIFAGYSKEYVSRQDKTDKNHLIIVRHADGRSSRYVHLGRLLIRQGQDVKAGDALGKSSESDEWTEPVVHFEIHEPNGKALDPMTLLTDPEKAPSP